MDSTTLVLGASGATGRELVNQLVAMGQRVKILVRPNSNIPSDWESNESISIFKANVSELSLDEMRKFMEGCTSVASCLGHNISLSGIFGKPRKLVADAIVLVCRAIIEKPFSRPFKVVLMNTTANRNKDLDEKYSLGEKIAMSIIRLLVPPQSDNEAAAEFLRSSIGQNHKSIQWVAVRPDSLADDTKVSAYTLHPSPTRSPVFDSGHTTRINVGHFMARLIVEGELWNEWKGKMPVIYNV